jgi:hypothetical protein
LVRSVSGAVLTRPFKVSRLQIPDGSVLAGGREANFSQKIPDN